jgi:hypothetical protein
MLEGFYSNPPEQPQVPTLAPLAVRQADCNALVPFSIDS